MNDIGAVEGAGTDGADAADAALAFIAFDGLRCFDLKGTPAANITLVGMRGGLIGDAALAAGGPAEGAAAGGITGGIAGGGGILEKVNGAGGAAVSLAAG